MTYGIPGSVTPATSSVPECRCASYQRLGIWWPRCMSFESSGLPVTVCAPETTQSFDPFTGSPSPRGPSIGNLSIDKASRCAERLGLVWLGLVWLGLGLGLG